ncbi:unnamed protein product [Diatraea saccharalis]|uniref:Uncharacterized protein n=1 Tax=Diatraea saccharalis TaxID=40085 RepID=A0A9N9RCN6_9NEOP|nr:unnamed protein product [Diatraea saccharalis]
MPEMVPLLLFLISILDSTKQEYIYNRKPVPKAEVLDEILSNFLNRSDFTGSLFSYLTGNEDFGDPDNLDVCVLNANNVFKIISKAKKQYEPYFRRTKQEGLKRNPKLAEQVLDLMKQSIYATRFRMQDTKRFRKKYANDARFQIAVLFGALMQVNLKMETIYSILHKFVPQIHMIWSVILYEKLLAAHVDVHNLVDRIFYLHSKQMEIESGATRVVLFPTLYNPRTRSRRRLSRGTLYRATRFNWFQELNLTYMTTQPPETTSTTRKTVRPIVG